MKTKINLSVVGGLVVIYMFFSAPLIQADTFIQAKRHTDSFTMMGQTQPAKDEVTTTWVGKDRCRTDTGEGQSVIVRLDQSKMYVLDHTKKTYSPIDLPFDWSKLIPPEAKQMTEQWMQMFKMTATVTDTGETKKIKGWNCRKYLVNLKGMIGIRGRPGPRMQPVLELLISLWSKVLYVNPYFMHVPAHHRMFFPLAHFHAAQ